MKRTRRAIILSVCSCIFAFSGLSSCRERNKSAPENGYVHDRVLEKKTLRVGYVVVSPTCIKDPNTGKMSGIFVEVLEAAAANLGLRVEWAEEVGWQTIAEGLPSRSDRYDMVGSSVWANADRAKVADFSVPVFYSPVGAWVRTNDHRFDQNLKTLDSKQMHIATIDGEISADIAKQRFPAASLFSLPQLSDLSQMGLEVIQGRADVVFWEPSIGAAFLKNHPGALRNIAIDRPVRVYPTSFMLPANDQPFRRMLDTALQELHNNGFIDRVLSKYEPTEGAFFYRVARPYESPSR